MPVDGPTDNMSERSFFDAVLIVNGHNQPGDQITACLTGTVTISEISKNLDGLEHVYKVRASGTSVEILIRELTTLIGISGRELVKYLEQQITAQTRRQSGPGDVSKHIRP